MVWKGLGLVGVRGRFGVVVVEVIWMVLVVVWLVGLGLWDV